MFTLVSVAVPVFISQLVYWPVALLPVFVCYAVLCAAYPELRRAPRWLQIGKTDSRVLIVTAVYTAVACAVLITWFRLSGPDLSSHAARIAVRAPALLLLTGVAFSVLNAFIEEAVFRGLLQTLLCERYPVLFAVLAQAILFGIGHYAGVPSGLPGVALSSLYGLGLGLIRTWSGGLAACVLSHIALDATIFSLVVASIR